MEPVTHPWLVPLAGPYRLHRSASLAYQNRCCAPRARQPRTPASLLGPTRSTPTADTAFAQDMSMHAATAMNLADQARTRSVDPQVQAHAEQVFTAVAPIANQFTELGPALVYTVQPLS